MSINPKNMIDGKIYTELVLNFDTIDKQRDNLIFIPTINRNSMYEVIKSKLFRPSQLSSAFSPSVIKPLNKKTIRYRLDDIFAEFKSKTNGKIRTCKISENLYADKNLIYDISNEYRETAKLVGEMKSTLTAYKTMAEFLSNSLNSKIDKLKYQDNYLIFPLVELIVDLKPKVISNVEEDLNPLIVFLKTFKNDGLDKYKKFKKIFFYNPLASAIIAINPNEEDLSFNTILNNINRLNEYNDNKSEEKLSDVEIAEPSTDAEDYLDTLKDNIKDVIFKKMAKLLKAKNLTNFDAATKEEQELILAIDRELDKYLSDTYNINKPFNELMDMIENNPEIKMKAIRFIETKKISNTKELNMSKNLEKELKTLDSLKEIVDTSGIIEEHTFKTKVKLDDKIQNSKLVSIDEEYNTKYLKSDIMEIISSFSNMGYLPAALEDVSIEDTSDDFNDKETLKVKMKTEDNQSLSYTIDIPKIVDGHYINVGGNKFTIAKQTLRLPIVKTKKDRVEIATGYLKMTASRAGSNVSRNNAYLMKILKDLQTTNPNLKVNYGDNSIINEKYSSDFEFEELAESISSIYIGDFEVQFNREISENKVNTMFVGEWNDERTPFAFDSKDNIYFIEDDFVYVSKSDGIEGTGLGLFEFLLTVVLKVSKDKLPKIGRSFTYSKVKFLKAPFPIFTLVGLMNGITNILKRHKTGYRFTEKPEKTTAGWVEVKFQNKVMYYEDTLKNTMLLNVLYLMDTENYDFEEFDTDRPYIDFLVSKLKLPLYVKNTVIINLDKMIDPITRNVLKDLKLPTDIIDLLLMANNMLINNTYKPLNDLSNYRIRGNELIPAALYKIIADAYVKFQNYKLNGRASNISIKKKELISKLLLQSNVNPASILNPILEIENAYSCSPKGLSGINMEKSFTMEARAYDPSMMGYLSGNSTAFSGNAGIARGLVYNPDVNSVRGYVNNIDREAEAVNLLAPSEMLSPFTSEKADPPRVAMVVAQSKHIMPVSVSHKQLFGSGVNKTLAYMLSDDFCFKAKQDGVVHEIDEEDELMILKYVDGSFDAINMKETMVKNSNSGFYIKQKFYVAFKQGEHFKKGEVIAYDPSFFKGKGNDMDYCSGTLCKVAMAPGDFAFEDATVITSKMAKKMASNVTFIKAVSLYENTVVHNIVDVGTDVVTNDTLLEFSEGFDSDTTNDFLAALEDSIGEEDAQLLSRDKVTSKYSGKVVDIKIYYNKPFEDLSPSLQKIINDYKSLIEKRKRKLSKSNVKGNSVKIPPVIQQTVDKINGVEFDGVLIEFYIEYLDELGVGDKISFATSLKGVISDVIPSEESPISEHRPEEEIEAICTPTGIIGRMTIDIYSLMYVNKALIEIGKKIKEIWES